MAIGAKRAAACVAVLVLAGCGGGSASDPKQDPASGDHPSPVSAADDGRHLSCDRYPKADVLSGTTICEERDSNGLPTGGDVKIDTDSGEILARGASRSSIDLKAFVFAKGLTQQRAEAIAQQVVIHTDGDHFYATGPSDSLLPPPVNVTLGLEGWWVSFELALPRNLSLNASSISATVEAHDLSGDIGLDSTSGQVIASGLGGQVSLSSDSADVDAAALSGSVAIGTTSGDVTVDLAGGSWDGAVSTTSGNVTLQAPAGYSATFVFQTMSGAIHSDFGGQPESSPGSQTLTETIGSGGALISATTTSGDIDLQKK